MQPGESKCPPADSPCKILLVEDNKINQKVVSLMLGKFGIHPALADSGADALELVRDQTFDLILMDLHMPGMGGVETTNRIRDVLGGSCPPIVALTADAVHGNEAIVLGQGLSGFLTKPISCEILQACILEQTGIAVTAADQGKD